MLGAMSGSVGSAVCISINDGAVESTTVWSGGEYSRPKEPGLTAWDGDG